MALRGTEGAHGVRTTQRWGIGGVLGKAWEAVQFMEQKEEVRSSMICPGLGRCGGAPCIYLFIRTCHNYQHRLCDLNNQTHADNSSTHA